MWVEEEAMPRGRVGERERDTVEMAGWGSHAGEHMGGAGKKLSHHTLSSDMWSKNVRWMMGLWINLCAGLPRSMDTKVGKIRAWMDRWILEGWGGVLVK